MHCCLQLTGEDPDAIPDEAPPPKRQQHTAPGSLRKQPEQQERPAAAEGRGPGGGRLADAWQAPGSLFSLLTSAEPAATDAKDGSKKKHKEHKHKKEKHKKKDKVGGGHSQAQQLCVGCMQVGALIGCCTGPTHVVLLSMFRPATSRHLQLLAHTVVACVRRTATAAGAAARTRAGAGATAGAAARSRSGSSRAVSHWGLRVRHRAAARGQAARSSSSGQQQGPTGSKSATGVVGMVTVVAAAAGIRMTTEGATAGAAGTLGTGRGTTGMTGPGQRVAAATEAAAEAEVGAEAVTAGGNIIELNTLGRRIQPVCQLQEKVISLAKNPETAAIAAVYRLSR